MIVFLTLCYCALLAVLVKLGIVKWNLRWKLSPLVWMLLLFIVLFIPMQWGAPSGPVNVYESVIEIIPNVTGEVIEVPVKGLTNLNEGDVLFRIDPTPYSKLVDQLQAQLANTKQDVLRLQASAEAARQTVRKTESDVALYQANLVAARSAVSAAEAVLQEAKGKREKAIAVRDDLRVQVTAAQREFDRISRLREQNAASDSDRDKAEIQLTGLKSQLNSAEVDVRVADDVIARSAADVKAAEANAVSADLQMKQVIDTELPRVQAKALEAELAANSMIGDVHTSVAAVEAQLERAEFDLEETVVRAPSDGYVVGATLLPGQRVANFPVRSWMSFVPTQSTTVVVGVPQYSLRHVAAGQQAEVTLKLFPGRTFSATVDEVVTVSSQGQLQPSGLLPAAPGSDQSAVPFGVKLMLDETEAIDVNRLPGGAVGTAAIYTDKLKATHVIRKVMIRMEAWMNYVLPN